MRPRQGLTPGASSPLSRTARIGAGLAGRAAARLDQHTVPLVGERPSARGSEGDSLLGNLDLLRYADNHGATMRTSASKPRRLAAADSPPYEGGRDRERGPSSSKRRHLPREGLL